MSRSVGVLAILSVICAYALLGCRHNAPPNASREERWRSDLEVLARELPARHASAFFHITESRWRAGVADLARRAATLDDAHLSVGVMRLVAALGDPHTAVFPGEVRYPLVFDWFPDGIFVTGAAEPWAIGRKLVGIGDHSTAEVIAALAPLISHDTEPWLHAGLPGSLVDATRLAGVDLASDHAVFQLAAEDGSVRTLDLRPGPRVVRALPAHRPLYLAHAGERSYWLSHVDRMLYIAYEACADDPRSEPFSALVARALAILDTEPVERIVLDLRNNGGGNESVLAPLIDGLAARPWLAGRLFVVIGKHTFSSANQNAMTLKQRLSAILVGSRTGARTSGYGEVERLTLPASRITLQYSTRYFDRRGYPSDIVDPDLPVELTSRDWFAGRDPILDAIAPARDVVVLPTGG